eukprot:1109752-Pyramimonas_sp.AAC.1
MANSACCPGSTAPDGGVYCFTVGRRRRRTHVVQFVVWPAVLSVSLGQSPGLTPRWPCGPNVHRRSQRLSRALASHTLHMRGPWAQGSSSRAAL